MVAGIQFLPIYMVCFVSSLLLLLFLGLVRLAYVTRILVKIKNACTFFWGFLNCGAAYLSSLIYGCNCGLNVIVKTPKSLTLLSRSVLDHILKPLSCLDKISHFPCILFGLCHYYNFSNCPSPISRKMYNCVQHVCYLIIPVILINADI